MYGRVVFKVNFHEEIMILAFILYTQKHKYAFMTPVYHSKASFCEDLVIKLFQLKSFFPVFPILFLGQGIGLDDLWWSIPDNENYSVMLLCRQTRDA